MERVNVMLHELQPVDLEWWDAAGLHLCWTTLREARQYEPQTIVTRGYFIAEHSGILIVCQNYGKDNEGDIMVLGVVAVPLMNVVRISPRRESLREKLVRLKYHVWGHKPCRRSEPLERNP